jgi:hypothetical protein
VTLLSDTHVPDKAFAEVATEFTGSEIAALVTALIAHDQRLEQDRGHHGALLAAWLLPAHAEEGAVGVN